MDHSTLAASLATPSQGSLRIYMFLWTPKGDLLGSLRSKATVTHAADQQVLSMVILATDQDALQI